MSTDQGPVVQSIASLTKSLANDFLNLLVHIKSSELIFSADKKRAFNGKSSSHCWQCVSYNMFENITLKAPITTAADNIHKSSLFFRENKT